MEWVISDDGSMSDDEGFVFFVAAGFALFGFWRFYRVLWGASPLYRNAWQVRALGVTPPLALLCFCRVLVAWADPIVRKSLGYILLFAFVDASFMLLVLKALPFFGLSYRDDVVEKNNPAATATVCGALAGITLAFAGSNVGSGPTIWTTIGPALLTLGLFWAAWRILEALSHCSEAIVLDRDGAAGARLAGFLVATGAVLGRAAAGDWVSEYETYSSLARGSVVVLALIAVAAVAHRVTRPTPTRPAPALLSTGVLVGGTYVLASGVWVFTTLPIR